jgi:hypothetical protein
MMDLLILSCLRPSSRHWKRYDTAKIGRFCGENMMVYLFVVVVVGVEGGILNLFTCVECRKQRSSG